jgi:glycosyltransferase involved in cell wall biosynthesis
MSSAMSKILFILHLPPPVHGSSLVGQYIHDCLIINKTFSTRFINLGTSKSVDEIGKNPLLKITRYLKILVSFIHHIFKFKPDLIYLAITAKGIGFYKDLPIALIAKIFRKKIVIHYHNKGVKTHQNNFFHNFFYKLLFKNTKVILLSNLLYDDVKKYVNEEDVYYCPNGIPVIECEKLNTNKNQILELLFLSNLIESKGVFVLLDALRILKNKKITFHCNFVGGEGDVSSQQLKQKISELNLEDKVTYHGKQFSADKYRLFNRSDIFVLPTFYENECFPLVLLEAMQFSLPLISTYEGAIPEIIENGVNGFLIKQRDKVDLANKIQQLIEKPSLRKSMERKGKEKFEREYTLSHFEQNMTEILTKII